MVALVDSFTFNIFILLDTVAVDDDVGWIGIVVLLLLLIVVVVLLVLLLLLVVVVVLLIEIGVGIRESLSDDNANDIVFGGESVFPSITSFKAYYIYIL